MIQSIEKSMAKQLRKAGVAAEITFCRADMFSVLVDDIGQFEKAKALLAQVPTVRFDSEDRDPELGNIAYYHF